MISRIFAWTILIMAAMFLSARGPIPKPSPQRQPSPVHSPKLQKDNGPQTQPAAQQTHPNSSTTPSSFNQFRASVPTNPSTTYAHYYYYYPEPSWNWPGWLEAIATIGLVFYSAFQFKYIRKSATAAAQAAIAAKENADAARFAANIARENVELQKALANATTKSADAAEAALHANRPFLLITGMRSEKAETGYLYTIYVRIRNFGIGPADIQDYCIDAEFLDPPIPPGAWELIPWWYGPDQGFALQDPLVISGEERDGLQTCVFIPPYERANITERKRWLGIHGRVRYRGALKQKYCTQFYWFYVPDEKDGWLIRPFPDRLNKYT